jgi:cytochrome P450
MFGAGSETSSTTMGWVMSELVSNPRVLAKAQQEVRAALSTDCVVTEEMVEKLSYLKLVVKETLRLHPPLPLVLPRECRTACKVLGYDVPQGTRMLVNVWAIVRDPEFWDEPEAFKPERFDGDSIDFRGANFEYLPVGAGRRICPGIHFGLANVELALAHLICYFDWELPVPGAKLDMAEAFGVTAGRKSDLILYAIPRFSCP